LFWTIRIPDESVDANLDDATASMDFHHLETKDFFTIPNSLMGGHHVPAIVSFEIRWSGVKKRVHTRDAKNHFVGDYIEDTAAIRWSAREKGFKFVSDPAHTSTNVFSEIGRERNGVFFS